MTILRLGQPNDAVALAALKLSTFRETFIEGFAIPYPAIDLAIFERASYSEDAVTRELADMRKMTWVVEREGELLAYAHVGPSKLPHPDVTNVSGELYQIYVSKSAQELGLGRKLLDTSLDWLRVNYPGPQWLGVWSGNHKAQAIYLANGFTKVGEYQFPVGDWRDDELIFRRP